MGYFGGWSVKPQLGMGNWKPGLHTFHTYWYCLIWSIEVYIDLFVCPCSHLSPWMGRLNRPLTAARRYHIRMLASMQKKKWRRNLWVRSRQRPRCYLSQHDVDSYKYIYYKYISYPGTVRSGGKDLSSSASYPRDFGREVAKLHLEYLELWW